MWSVCLFDRNSPAVLTPVRICWAKTGLSKRSTVAFYAHLENANSK